jgi:hypothetical protein
MLFDFYHSPAAGLHGYIIANNTLVYMNKAKLPFIVT